MSAEIDEIDELVEQAIARAAQRLVDEPSFDGKLAALEELRRLHALRTPERIKAMERERGLA